MGCGPGNSTEVLHPRWPRARISGLDSLEQMIAQAEASHDWGAWVCADAAVLGEGADRGTWDLVSSNAVLQWIPDHEHWVPRLFGLVRQGGALAVQVPASAGSASRLVYHEPSFYFGLLCRLAERLEVWETTCHHELPDPQALLE